MGIKDEEEDEGDTSLPSSVNTASPAPLPKGEEIIVSSPAEGKCIPLSHVKDATFAQGILGKGAAVIPSKGIIQSPFDGTVDVMFETGHAVGLTSESGVELLIHVGMDTVNLEGKYFTPGKATGDKVKKGEIILEFDAPEIQKAGYDITTPVIVSNSDKYADVRAIESDSVKMGDTLLRIR